MGGEWLVASCPRDALLGCEGCKAQGRAATVLSGGLCSGDKAGLQSRPPEAQRLGRNSHLQNGRRSAPRQAAVMPTTRLPHDRQPVLSPLMCGRQACCPQPPGTTGVNVMLVFPSPHLRLVCPHLQPWHPSLSPTPASGQAPSPAPTSPQEGWWTSTGTGLSGLVAPLSSCPKHGSITHSTAHRIWVWDVPQAGPGAHTSPLSSHRPPCR